MNKAAGFFALDKLLKLKTWQLLGLTFIVLFAVFGVSGKLGFIGTDNDDVMRLIQIRDLLAGQSWYDHSQYRMGGAGGTPMHWSRVIDAPVAALMWVFGLLLPQALAEKIAISIWPIITGLGLIIGVRLLQKDETRDDLKPFILLFGLLLVGLMLVTFYMFAPGRIDHHNVQLVAIALAFIGLSDPAYSARRFGLAGIMTGLSLVIGTEALPLLAINCGFVALLWAYKGADVTRAVRAFGLGFALTALCGFLMDTPPSDYGQIYCDVLAVNYLALALLGGLGLAGLTYIGATKNLISRLIALAILGGVCGAALLMISPECLSNPLGALPENAQRFWLDHVEEAQPLLSTRGVENGAFLYFIGFVAFGALVSLWRYKAVGFTPARIYALVLLASISAMIMYQLRYFPFGLVVATFMLISWVAEVFVDGKAKSKDSVAYIFALALSCASLWLLPSSLIEKRNGGDIEVVSGAVVNSHNHAASADNSAAAQDNIDACFPESLKTYLQSRRVQTLLAEPNLSSPVLQFTPQRALNGNYHRNGAGIDLAVQMFLLAPDEALTMMRAHDIGHVIYCSERSAYKIYAKGKKDSLAAHVIKGSLPAPFIRVDAVGNDKVSVWRLP